MPFSAIQSSTPTFPTQSNTKTPITSLWGSITAPYPTGAFWINLVVGTGDQNVVCLPWQIQAKSQGIDISTSVDRGTYVDPAVNYVTAVFTNFTRELSLEVVESVTSHFVQSYSNLGVVKRYNTASGSVEFPLVYGMDSVTGRYTNATPVLNTSRTITSINGSTSNGVIIGSKFKIVFSTGRTFIVYSTGNIALNWSGSSLQSTGVFTGALKVYFLNSASDESIYDTYKNAIVIAGTVTESVNYGAKTCQTVFNWSIIGSGSLHHFCLPHHRDILSSPSYTSTRHNTLSGDMYGIVGNSWIMNDAITAHSLVHTNQTVDSTILTSITNAYNNDKGRLVDSTDSYFSSVKEFSLARILLIGRQLGFNTTTPLANLKSDIEGWLDGTNPNPFKYDDIWRGICTKVGLDNVASSVDRTSDFFNGSYTDHHFHYGYKLYAFAAIALTDPTWATAPRIAKIKELARDIANPDATADPYFPKFRHKDPFLGHSWASGVSVSLDGKSHESSGQACTNYFCIEFLGYVLGDTNLRDIGAYLYQTEIRSAKKYYQVKSTDDIYNISTFSTKKVVGIRHQRKLTYGTFFGSTASNEEYIHLIQAISFSPHTKDVLDVNWIKEEYPVLRNIVNNSGTISDEWRTRSYMVQSMIDKTNAYKEMTGSFAPSSFTGEDTLTNSLFFIALQPSTVQPAVINRPERLFTEEGVISTRVLARGFRSPYAEKSANNTFLGNNTFKNGITLQGTNSLVFRDTGGTLKAFQKYNLDSTTGIETLRIWRFLPDGVNAASMLEFNLASSRATFSGIIEAKSGIDYKGSYTSYITQSFIRTDTAGNNPVRRVSFGLDNAGESGVEGEGSDLAFTRWSNDGVSANPIARFVRKTGEAIFYAGVESRTKLEVSGSFGQYLSQTFQRIDTNTGLGLARFNFGLDNTAETATEGEGSDFSFTRWSNDGLTASGVFKVNRKTGDIQMFSSAIRTGAAGTYRPIKFATNGTSRFSLQLNADAESTANAGSNFEITTSNDDGTYLATPLKIDRATSGTFFAGRATFNNGLNINGPVLNYRTLRFQSSGLDRLTLQISNEAESGSNAGSNFSLATHNDDGSYKETPFSINRSTGTATFTKPISANGIDSTGSYTLSGPAANPRNFKYKTAGVDRFMVGINAAPESGSNAGSNFNISSYNDDGSYKETPFQIERSTGKVSFSTPLLANSIIASGQISVDNSAGTFRSFALRTAGQNRFTLNINDVAEAGSDVGSDFTLTRWSDSGTPLANIRVDRATGKFNMVSADLALTSASGRAKVIEINTNDVRRWTIGSTAIAESGSNAGSDLRLERWDDSGVSLGSVLNINRANGQAVWSSLNYLQGGLKLKSRITTTNITVNASDNIVYLNASSGNVNADLPAIASNTDMMVAFVRTDNSGNTATVTANGANTINGSASISLPTQYKTYTLHNNGTAWFIIAQS